MNSLYCAACGQQLSVIKRGLPKMALVIDVVEPHVCSTEPATFSPPSKVPLKFLNEPGSYKFVQSLNELEPPPVRLTFPDLDSLSKKAEPKVNRIPRSPMTGTDDLRDRRFDAEEKASSAAPVSVLDMIKGMHPSEPSKPIPTESEEPSND